MRRMVFKVVLLSLAIPLALYGQKAGTGVAFPITIHRVDARCVEVLRAVVGESRSMPPQYFYAPSGFLFRFTVEIHVVNDTLSPGAAFRLVALLPGGERFQSLVKTEDLIPSRSSLYSFSLDAPVKKNGWADIIIVPSEADAKPDLYDYEVRSNKHSISLECHLQTDVTR